MTSLSIRKMRETLSDTMNVVAYRGERIIVKRRGKEIAAVVPIADLDVLRKMEDKMDLKILKAELKKKNQSVPYDKVRKELGLK